MKTLLKCVFIFSAFTLIFINIYYKSFDTVSDDYESSSLSLILKEPSKEDLRNVLYTLDDFDEYFDKVYIDSTNLYLSQNILKLAKPEKLDFYLDIFSLNNYKELIDFIFLNVDGIYSKEKINIGNKIMFDMMNFYKNDNFNKDIGKNIILSITNTNTDYKDNNYYKINLNRKNTKNHITAEDYLIKVINLIDKIDRKICKIDYVVSYDERVYKHLKKIKINNKLSSDIILDNYIFCHSENLSDMNIALENIKEYHPDIEIKSILDYVVNDNIRGDNYKKIIKFINNNKGEKLKNKNSNYDDFIFLLDDLGSIEDNFFKKNNIELIKKYTTEIKFLYMQSNFNKYFEQHKKMLYDVSPITIDYINSSIKNDYYSSSDEYYIAKIKMNGGNKILKNYFNRVFNKKTSVNKELSLFKNIMIYNIFIFSLMLSVMYIYYKIYLRGK